MCWLPIDQPLLLPGDSSTCSGRRPSPCSVAQLLASRLRRIGDQLEKGWAAAGEQEEEEEEAGERGSCTAGLRRLRGLRGLRRPGARRGHMHSFLSTAIHLTVLVLLVARRHL